LARKMPIERKNFGRIPSGCELPNLLDVQLKSYDDFLQGKVDPDKRARQGLHQIFHEIFPISDIRENYTLEFVNYKMGTRRYSISECQERNMSYASPLKATLRLVSREGEGDEKQVKDIIEQDVYLGELPTMTRRGTFVINGSERVIVSQLHRSPGVFFNEDIHPNGKHIFSARIIPYRGSWVEFTTDINDIMFVHIDSRRKSMRLPYCAHLDIPQMKKYSMFFMMLPR
jgi:DNA-directed RNA polymerase subunit beta